MKRKGALPLPPVYFEKEERLFRYGCSMTNKIKCLLKGTHSGRRSERERAGHEGATFVWLHYIIRSVEVNIEKMVWGMEQITENVN